MTMGNKSLRRCVLIVVASLTLGACSTAPVQEGEELIEPAFSSERVLLADDTYPADEISDPWEGFNRPIYRFNYWSDQYVFLPAVSVYQAVLPDFAEKGVHNFFTNLRQLTTLFNSVLQLSPRKSIDTAGRFIVNTTVGVAGFFDVASALDMPHHQEDFGQTLGYWGVGNGPYLVLPLLGPSNLRDSIGYGVDWLTRTTLREEALDPELWQEWLWDTTDAIDTRAQIAFRYYETGSPFEYEWVRLLYTTKRKLDIEK